MALRTFESARTTHQPSNLSRAERWFSVLAGVGLTLLAARRGGALRRTALGTAGTALLTRGATGYCAAKGAMTGQTTLGQGLREQWYRVRSGFQGSGAASIDSMEALYVAELQELHSAEAQLALLLEDLEDAVDHMPLRNRLSAYASEIRTRLRDLELLVDGLNAQVDEHPDQAMQALIGETWKMAQVCAPAVRTAALVASLQRLIHYKLASYGTVAAYAKVLGQIEEAARFAAHADHDKAVDQELSDLATQSLNPRATVDPHKHGSPEARPH